MSHNVVEDSKTLFLLSLLGIFASPIWLVILVGLTLPLLFAFGPLVITAIWALNGVWKVFLHLFIREQW